MDATSSEYEFLDLTDINDEDRNSLTSALFAPAPTQPPTSRDGNWSQSERADSQGPWRDQNFAINDAVNMTTLYVVHPQNVDLSSCSSGTPGPPTASSSLDSIPTEREMAPHSPQRNPPAQTAVPPSVPAVPPLAYSQPPPHLYPAPNSQHWPQHLMSPNVYVSQVTANVNVHGYMGQYYQPQFVAHAPTEQRGRDGRDRGKGRRGGGAKRTQSPPNYLLHSYPQFYPTPQTAQGAPLYHMPVYPHPMGYLSYPYMPYMEYGMMDDPNQGDKGPEEYPPEMMIEPEQHVPHDIYYHPHPSCIPQTSMYDPNRPMEGPCSLEPYPQFYPMPPYQPQPPPVHQFNVHAKNFVRQNDHKNYAQQSGEIKIQENANQPKNNHQGQASNANNAALVETLSMKDLKISISKPPMVPKQILEKPNINQQATAKPIVMSSDKVAPKIQADILKPAWTGNVSKFTDNKGLPVTNNTQTQVTVPSTVVNVNNKSITLPPTNVTVSNKINKSANPIPFVNNSFVKGGPSQQLAQVIMPQHDLPAKAPFTKKHKKEQSVKNQEVPEQSDVISPTVTPPEVKLNAAPKPAMPVAIPVQGTTSITTKAPFSHIRKSSVTSAEAPIVTATPPAPTASDFPPPPAPRRSIDQPPISQPAVVQPPPSGNKTWASLFCSPTAPTSTAPSDETASTQTPVNTITPAATTNQRPIAKVGPFDSSPLQNEVVDKSTNISSHQYEKPSNSINQNQKIVNKDISKENNINSSTTNHINDPNSYRMGEFLAKYQLDHHTVSLQPRGLSNRSNYCYINAILQALIGCPPFYNMLKSLPYQLKKGKSNTPIIDAMVELCGEFSTGVRITRPERPPRASLAATNAADSGEQTAVPPPINVGPAFEPSTVLHMLRDMNNGESFRVEGRQEDAEEFLGCLLNGLNDEMLELIKLVEPEDTKEPPVVVNGNDVSQESEDDDEWKVMGRKNKGSIERRCSAGRTPLSDIFRGQLRSRLQRATDTTTTDTTHCVQPFFTLPLDIERSNSVHEALERVAGKDRLEGVTCPSKGRPVEAWQQVLLEQLPAVLVLHLKCFHSRPGDGATVKLVKAINYPVDLKIDTKIISKAKCNIKQRSYKLFAVVYHEGSEAEKGHYLTDVYHVGCGGWLRYDDSVVTSVTEQQVLHPRLPRTPYLLLYRRQDTMQGPRHQQTN